MLFFSSLDNIGDEISLLNSINNGLQENSGEEIKGFKKGDFKILWIPIVDDWNNQNIQQLYHIFKFRISNSVTEAVILYPS